MATQSENAFFSGIFFAGILAGLLLGFISCVNGPANGECEYRCRKIASYDYKVDFNKGECMCLVPVSNLERGQ